MLLRLLLNIITFDKNKSRENNFIKTFNLFGNAKWMHFRDTRDASESFLLAAAARGSCTGRCRGKLLNFHSVVAPRRRLCNICWFAGAKYKIKTSICSLLLVMSERRTQSILYCATWFIAHSFNENADYVCRKFTVLLCFTNTNGVSYNFYFWLARNVSIFIFQSQRLWCVCRNYRLAKKKSMRKKAVRWGRNRKS